MRLSTGLRSFRTLREDTAKHQCDDRHLFSNSRLEQRMRRPGGLAYAAAVFSLSAPARPAVAVTTRPVDEIRAAPATLSRPRLGQVLAGTTFHSVLSEVQPADVSHVLRP
jgi:hypothetical protein